MDKMPVCLGLSFTLELFAKANIITILNKPLSLNIRHITLVKRFFPICFSLTLYLSVSGLFVDVCWLSPPDRKCWSAPETRGPLSRFHTHSTLSPHPPHPPTHTHTHTHYTLLRWACLLFSRFQTEFNGSLIILSTTPAASLRAKRWLARIAAFTSIKLKTHSVCAQCTHLLTVAPGDVALSIWFYVRNNKARFWVSLSDRYKEQSSHLEHIIRLRAVHMICMKTLSFTKKKKKSVSLDIFDFANCRGEGGSNTVNKINFLRTHTHIKKLHPAASRSGSNTHTRSQQMRWQHFLHYCGAIKAVLLLAERTQWGIMYLITSWH